MVVSFYGSPSNAYAESCHQPKGNALDGNSKIVIFLMDPGRKSAYIMIYDVIIRRKISILENVNVKQLRL